MAPPRSDSSEFPIPNPFVLAAIGVVVLLVAPWVAGVWSDPSVATVLPIVIVAVIWGGVVGLAVAARRNR